MATIVTLATVQQQKEYPLVEIDSEDENTSPDHKSIENDKPVEKSYEENDPIINLLNAGLDRHSHDISECKPSFARNSSPTRCNKHHQRVIK